MTTAGSPRSASTRSTRPTAGVVEPIELVTVDHPVEHLLVTDDGTSLAAASADRLTTIDLDGATVLGSIELSGIADLAPGGSGPALTAVVDAETVPATLAASLADILGTDADDYVARLTGVTPGTTVVLGEPGSGTGADRPRQGDRRRLASGRGGRHGPAHRGRHRRPGSSSSCPTAPLACRRSRSTAARTAWRW